ncbi:MAG: DNA primase [Betaproteobacteria bacterium]|nr:DNA primase [Betaproteobacteria bacterium]
MIPESFKQDLLNRVDIVEVIERHIRLKKSGANYVACCPFHTEKTPSFTVSSPKQFYHCFGCGANGNAISFVMEYQGLGYVEALRDLAESVGMKLPEFEPRGTNKSDAGADLYEILQRAAGYYREQLKGAPEAIDYLKRRGLTGKIAARFGIGYAPAGWQNLEAVFPDYQDKALRECGLVIDGEGGRRYDRFRDRIMFPILNQRGSVIGFGGRVLGDGEPKYLNSPETPLFDKGRELYGLSQARAAIRQGGRAIVVEGYMDVVALSQHGIEYAVATLGTATSAVHVQKLFRQTDEIVFCFDGDAAGRRAAWHALEVSLPVLEDHKAVKFLLLPPEHDPDSFVRERGSEAFERMLGETQPLSDFLLEQLMSRVDMRTAEGRSRLIHEAKPLLKRIAAPALQLQMVKRLAEFSSTTQEEAARLTDIRIVAGRGFPQRPAAARAASESRGRHQPQRGLYRQLLRGLFVRPALVLEVPLEELNVSLPEAQVLSELAAICRAESGLHVDSVIERLSVPEHVEIMKRVRASLLESKLEDENIEIEFQGAITTLRAQRRNPRLHELEQKAETQGLSDQEYDEYRGLIADDAALKQSRSTQPSVL